MEEEEGRALPRVWLIRTRAAWRRKKATAAACVVDPKKGAWRSKAVAAACHRHRMVPLPVLLLALPCQGASPLPHTGKRRCFLGLLQ